MFDSTPSPACDCRPAAAPKVEAEDPAASNVKRLQAKVDTLRQMAQLAKGSQKRNVEKKLFAALSKLSDLLTHDSDDDDDDDDDDGDGDGDAE